MDSNSQQSEEPVYCRKGCGFFGNKETDRLCSKCFKDEMKKKQKTEPSETTTSASLTSSILTSTQLSAIATTQSSVPTAAVSSSSSKSPAVITSSAVSAALSEALSTRASPSPQQASSLSTAAETQGSSPLNNLPSDKVCDGASSFESPTANATATASTESPATPNDGSESPATTRKKNKCQVCRKKVGLTGFTCRCGGLFCPLHRYNNEHDCTFDYRQYGQDEIRRNNPAVKGEKIRKM